MEALNDTGYTLADLYALPDGERSELIDGNIHMIGPPSRTHQKLVGRLNQWITQLKFILNLGKAERNSYGTKTDS